MNKKLRVLNVEDSELDPELLSRALLQAGLIIIKDENGESVGVRGITTDVTKRKEAEQSLRQQKEILQQVFEHIPLMISFFEKDGRRKLVNKEWQHVFGWTQEQAVSAEFDIFAESYPDPLE